MRYQHPGPPTSAKEFILNPTFFPKPFTISLCYILRLLKVARYIFRALGLPALSEKLDDFGLYLTIKAICLFRPTSFGIDVLFHGDDAEQANVQPRGTK